jgi:signal transduction histidine kinase
MRKSGTTSANKPTRVQIAGNPSARIQSARFESLLDELSTAMTRASADEIDNEIKKLLSRIVLALDVDGGTVWERRTPDTGFVSTCWWGRPGIPTPPRKLISMKISPWLTAQALSGNLIAYSSTRELPKDEVNLRRFLKTHGPKAQVVLPLQIEGLVLGALTFGNFRGSRYWSPRELQRLRVVGQIVAAALDRKRAVLQNRKFREELAVSARRSMLSELTMSIAQELNRPLGAIMSNLSGLTRLLSQKNPKPKVASTAVRNALEDTKRAAQVVRRFRGMFAGDENKRVTIDIRQLVDDVAKLAGSEAGTREVNLQLDQSSSRFRTIGNRLQLQQCVLNLLMNALDATEQIKSGPREVTVAIAPEKTGWIQIRVSDNGAGVDPSIANRIFETVVTTKTKGIGTGLLVTRSIVEGHGGRVWFTANPGGGSTFGLTLPLAKKEARPLSRREQ